MKDREEGEEEESHRASAAGSSSPPHQPPPPCPATHIHQLPNEVLAKIFVLLSQKTIGKQRSVCRRWHDVIEDWELIVRLKFEDGTFTTEEALCQIRSTPGLKSLELVERSDTLALLDAVSARCTNLLHLSVTFSPYDITGSLTGALTRVFQANPRITDLRLIYSGASKDLRFYLELGSLLPDLRKLEFNIRQLYGLQLHVLLEGYSRNQMEEFKALYYPCSDAHVMKLVQFWGRSLQVLELDASRLTDGALAWLGGCSELRRLKLSQLSVSWCGLPALTALSHLEDLALTLAREVQQDNWCFFFRRSRSSHGLRKLSLNGLSGVDDRVLASVAASCPELEELEVRGRLMTISGVQEVLRGCCKLHNLDLHGTRDASVARIVPDLAQLAPQLRRIRIGSFTKSFLDEATLRRVQMQMPHLIIW